MEKSSLLAVTVGADLPSGLVRFPVHRPAMSAAGIRWMVWEP